MAFFSWLNRRGDQGQPGEPLFEEAKACSLCYENKEHQVRLACGHLLCSDCLQKSRISTCAYRCAEGDFDRKLAMSMLGIEEPVLPPKQPRPPVGRPYTDVDDLQGQSEALPRNAICGLSTKEVCPDSNCPFHEGEVLNAWGEGSHDIAGSPTKTMCRCGKDRCVRALILTDCHAQLTVIEAFNNGKKKRYERSVDSRGKVTKFDLPGHYTRFEVIASRAIILPRPPQSRNRKPKALILSVEEDRPGCNEEQASAKQFFQLCGYDVILEKNPDYHSFIDAIRRFRMQQHAGTCAIAIMAHGVGGTITLKDGRCIELNQVFAMLDSKHAAEMTAVQKYFFVQACRKRERPLCQDPAFDGDDMSVSGTGDSADLDDLVDGPDGGNMEFTRSANFHWCYATTPGVVAYRGKMFEALKKAAAEMRGGRMEDICRRANAILIEEQHLLMHVQHTLTDFA